MLRKGVSGLEWLVWYMTDGRQRREMGRADKDQIAEDLEMHA